MKKTSKKIFLFTFILIAITPLYSQVKQSHSIVIGFLQLKEHFEIGLVFNGIELEYRYGLLWNVNNNEIQYQPKLGIGVGFNRGMTAIQIKIAPVNLTWTRPFYKNNGHTIKGGVNFVTDYSYQYYPSLHDAHLFWESEIGFSPVFNYNYQWDSRQIGVNFKNSLFGFTSHTQGYDPTYYSTDNVNDIKNYFIKPHENMKFGSFNNYNHTNISFEFVPNIEKIHSLLYEFDYFASYYGMRFDRINHNFIWRMSI